MYNYISIHSKDYLTALKSEELEKYLSNELGFIRISHLKFNRTINGVDVNITGIHASIDGNYAFDTLDGVEEVNLIEINLPPITDESFEQELADIAKAIAKKCSWIIDDDHGLGEWG